MITLSLIPRSTPAAALAADTGVAQGGTALNIQPASASAVAPVAPASSFPRTSKPTADFEAVRAGVRSIVETVVVDLTAARSLAAGNALVLPIQGTSYYIDKKPDVGSAVLHLQDQTTTPANSIFVAPGDSAKIPFTFIVIENAAQPGLVLRIHYGTDVEFQAGLSSIVRPAWYDRNPLSVFKSFNLAAVAPHVNTVRWTYTVPAGRKAMIESVMIETFRDAVAGAAGLFIGFIRYAVGGAGGDAYVVARSNANTLGAESRINESQGGIMFAGDVLTGETVDGSTGGTVLYMVNAKITEFDA